MHDRYEAIEEGRARAEDYQRIVLIIDMYPLLSMLIRDNWRQARAGLSGEQPEEHPAIRKLRALGVMARGAKMNLVLGSARPAVSDFPEGFFDQFGGRIALGRQTAESAALMFGDATAGRDILLGACGVGAAATAGGPERITVGWLPDPSDYPGGSRPADGAADEPWPLLLAMLPVGATWDGPVPRTGKSQLSET